MDHPPPWAWNPGGSGDDWLRAANGEIVINAGDGCTWPATPYVGELVRAAPEMASMLRKLEWVVDEDIGGPVCPVCCGTPKDHGGVGHLPTFDNGEKPCQLAALLARLDAARKAGG